MHNNTTQHNTAQPNTLSHLQEVQHELKFLEGMQDEDGGVFCVVKPNTAFGEYYE